MPLEDYAIMSLKDIFNNAMPVKVVVEIGACHGLDTQRFLNVFKECQVYSVEPKSVNVRDWKKLHGSNKRASLFEGVISDIDGTVGLYVSDLKYKGASSIRKPTQTLLERYPDMSFDSYISVPSMTLQSFLNKYKIDGVVDFMWIDAQGAENKIISGGLNAINRQVKTMFIEISVQEDYSGQVLVDELITMLPNFEVVGRFQDNLFMRNKNL